MEGLLSQLLHGCSAGPGLLWTLWGPTHGEPAKGAHRQFEGVVDHRCHVSEWVQTMMSCFCWFYPFSHVLNFSPVGWFLTQVLAFLCHGYKIKTSSNLWGCAYFVYDNCYVQCSKANMPRFIKSPVTFEAENSVDGICQVQIPLTSNFSPMDPFLSPKSTIYMPWVLNKVTSSDLWGRWFCRHDICHIQIPSYDICPYIANICHDIQRRWPPASSEAADFVLIILAISIYTLPQISASLVHS